MKTKERIKLVKKAKKEIDALSKKRDKVFDHLLRKLGIDPVIGDDELLFDYLYNNCGTATSTVKGTEFPK
jgi:hypothetical protein